MNLNQSAFAKGTPFSRKRQIPLRAFVKIPKILLSTLFLVMFSVQSFGQIDTTPPFVDFGSEFTIELDENGHATVTVDAVGGDDFDDNGELLTFTFSQTDFDCSDMAAPTEVTITVTNAAGISASTVMNAIVEDNMGPILVTNHVVVQLDAEGNGTYTIEDVFSTDSRDNCGGAITFQIGGSPTVNQDDVANSPFTRTVKGQDQYGNNTRTRVTITVLDHVVDETPPTVITQDITVQLDATGNGSISASQIDNGSNDASGIASVEFLTSTTVGELINNGGFDSNASGWLAIGNDGNGGFRSSGGSPGGGFVLNGVAALNADPSISQAVSGLIPGTIYTLTGDYRNFFDCCGAFVGQTSFGVDLDGAEIAAFPNPGTNFSPFSVSFTATAETQTIRFRSEINGTDTDIAIDNISISAPAENTTTSSIDYDCSQIGQLIEVTLLVTDVNGNQSTATANVTVEDNIDPALVGVPTDVTIEFNAVPAVATVSATDNCANPPVTFTEERIDGISSNNYILTRTWTATDESGNTVSGIQVITVEDATAPIAITKDITVYLDANGNASITPEQVDNGSSDESGEFTLSLDQTTFNCNDFSASCSASSIEFNGTGIASGANGDNIQNLGLNQLTMEAWVKPNGGSVNSIIRKAGDYDLYIVNNIVYAEVWYEGRASSAQYLYAGPTVPSSGWSHLAFTFDKTNNGTGKFYVNGVETVATGTIRSITPDITLGIGGSTEFGQSFTGLIDDVRIWSTERTNAQINEFKDFCIDANSVGLEAYFKIEANEGTTLTDYSGNGNHLTIEGTSWSTEGAPIERKEVEVTLTVTDESNNASSAIANVIVLDNIAPTLIGVPADVTVAFGSVPTAATVSAADNCSATPLVTFNEERTDGISNTNYILTRAWVATDESGNTVSGTQVITVEDAIAPIVITKDITVELDANGNASITPVDVNNGSTDNSGSELTYTLDQSTFDCDDLEARNVATIVSDNTWTQSTGVIDTPQPFLSVINQLPAVNTYTMGATVQDPYGQANFFKPAIPGASAIRSFGRMKFFRNNFELTGRPQSLRLRARVDNVMEIFINGVSIGIEGDFDTRNFSNSVYHDLFIDDTGIQNGYEGGMEFDFITSQSILDLLKEGDNEIVFAIGNLNNNVDDGGFMVRMDAVADGVPVQLTATDESGNSSSAQAFVVVEDNIAPVITAPADISVFATSASGAVVNYATPVGTDNCSVTTALISGFADGATFPIGTTVVTYTATDGSDNTASTSFNVEVSGLAPEIITPSNITVSTDAGECGAIVAYVATETTAIPASTITYDIASGSSFALGTTIVTATASNAVGTSTKTFTVTVEDNIIPSIIAPADISIFATSPLGAVVNYLTPVGIDNCLVTTVLTTGLVDGATFPIGNTVVTYTATDASGNSTAASFNVEVSGLAPEIITPANITVSKDAGQCGAIVDYTATETTAIPASVITYDIPPGSNFAVGTTTVTSTATNAVGASTKTFTVTVVDDENPNAITQDLTVELDANGSATINASQVDNGSSDECGIQSITLDKTTFDCSNLGTNAVTLTVTDVNGNVSLAEATVMVVDVIAPTVITKDVTVELDENGAYTVTAGDINNGTFDNCTFDLSVDNNSFDCSTLGEHIVTLTATDASGNTTSESAVVTVIDNAGPVIVVKDIDVFLDENGNASITLEDVNEGVTDGCGVTSTTIDITSFDCSNLGANTVTLTATDIHGNTSTGTTTVTVIDNIAPTVITKNITVDLDANGNAIISPIDVVVQEETTEYCSVTNASRYGILLYRYIKRYRRTSNARVSAYSFQARGRTFRKNPDGTATITGYMVDRRDAGDSWLVTINLKNARSWEEWSALGKTFEGNRNVVGDKYLDWTYYEIAEGSVLRGAGRNRGESVLIRNSRGVQVGDGANTQNSNYGMSGLFSYVNRRRQTSRGRIYFDLDNCISRTKTPEGPLTDDNCEIASTSLDITNFDCSNIGDNIVNVTVTDKSGNATTVPATVTVRDVTKPVARAKNITVTLGADGTVTIDPKLLDAGSTDNCEIVSYSLSRDTFTCRDIQNQSYYRRNLSIALTVTDAAGNSSRTVATVYVTERQAPVVSTEPITLVVYGRQRARASRREISKRVTDNCGVQRLYHQRRIFSRSNAGLNYLWVVAIDNSGNRTNGFVRVNVVDITKYGRVVPMCYKGRPIRVRDSQVKRWLSRGASIGTCSTDITMTVDGTNLNQQIAELEPEPVHEPIIELGAYPNPSQGMTNITFSSDVAGPAQMIVVSTGGVRMTTLFDGDIAADQNVKVRYNTNDLPSGMYIIRLVTAGEIRSLKLIVKK